MANFFKSLAERLASPFIDLAHSLGTPLREVGEALRGLGVSLEVSAIQKEERAIDQQETQTRALIGSGLDELPDPAGIPEAITKQRRQFSWIIQFDVLDSVTGERNTRYISVSTDSQLTPNEAMAEAEEVITKEYGVEKQAIISSEVTRVTKAGALGTL